MSWPRWWTGPARTSGTADLDLVTLGFALDHHGIERAVASSPVRQLVRERITTEVTPAALMAFTAHMALRQVDWAIRHHGPTQIEGWTEIAEDWLTWAPHDLLSNPGARPDQGQA